MNLYQPFGGPNLINPWLNRAPIAQNMPNDDRNTNCGLPPGLPLPPTTPNMNNARPVVPMKEPLLYFTEKIELKPPSAYEQPLHAHDQQHQQQFSGQREIQQQFSGQPEHQQQFSGQPEHRQQFSGQPEHQQQFSGQPEHRQQFSGQPEHRQQFSGQPEHRQQFSGQPEHRQQFSGQPEHRQQFSDQWENQQQFSGHLERNWQFKKPKYDKRKKKKAWRENKQNAANRNNRTGFFNETKIQSSFITGRQSDTNSNWTALKNFSFKSRIDNPIGLSKRLSSGEMEFISGGISNRKLDSFGGSQLGSDAMENNVDGEENNVDEEQNNVDEEENNVDEEENNVDEEENNVDEEEDNVDEEYSEEMNEECCSNDNGIENEVCDGGETEEEAEDNLDDDDEQSARVTSGRMRKLPNNMRITLQNGKRTAKRIVTEKKETFFCHICNVCCTSKEVFDTHNAAESHFTAMGALEAVKRVKMNTLLSKMGNSSIQHQPLYENKNKKFCKICEIRIMGDTMEHMKSLEHKMAKIKNKPHCLVCDLCFRSPKQFVAHCKTPHHLENVKLKAKAKVVESLPKKCEVPTVVVDDEVKEENMIEVDGDISTWTGTEVGSSVLVPLTGLFCKVCKKYYEDRSRAAKHCRSLAHFNNYKEFLDKMRQKQEQ